MAAKLRSSAKDTYSVRKANAVGFAKRQLRKAEATLGTDPDVYEYSSGKNKRAAITLSLDKSETQGLDVDLHDKDGEDALRARIIGTREGMDTVINSEDDEEIDSDCAFEESDEDRFAGFSFTKKHSLKKDNRRCRTPATVQLAEVDLSEGEVDDTSVSESQEDEDDEEMKGDNGEYLDVLDVLDGRGEPNFGDDKGQELSEDEDDTEQNNSNEDEDEDEEGEEEEIADPFVPSDTEKQPDEDALDTLGTFVSQLGTGNKRKAADVPDTANENAQPPSRKRRVLKERTEAGVEGEFGAYAGTSSRLQLDDLLTPLASMSSSLAALKEAIKPLTKGDALAPPLPQRTQDRLDREAAYEQTKAEVDKWNATIKRIKEAEHLSFPLQAPQKLKPSASGLAANFKPSNRLENAVDKLLRAAQMREESDIAKMEELKMNHLSIEEVAERRAQLRKMRDLMFRAEAKAKRIAKIKSKAYRKIHRKSRDRVKNLIKEAEGGYAEDDAKEVQMRQEVERARERATLRHKNTGKWAKAMQARGELDVDQRREIEEMLDKGERLRARIHGSDGDEDDEESEGEEDVDEIKANAFEELQRVEQADKDLPLRADKGVFAMKFMQDAMARDAQKLRAIADDFRDEMGQAENSSMTGSDNEEKETGLRGLQVQRIGGRVVYKPGQVTIPPLGIAPSESSSTLKSSEPPLQSPAVASQGTMRPSPPAPSTEPAKDPPPVPKTVDKEVNPWLTRSTSFTRKPKRKNEILVGKHSKDAAKSKHAMKKQLLKADAECQKAQDDAVVEISTDATLKLPADTGSQEDPPKNTKPAVAKEMEKSPRNGHQVDAAFEDSDANSEAEVQEQQQTFKGKARRMKAFQQRDLVALAFAGDNVVQDFGKLKQREVAADAPREEDHTLPGWGSWGGAGVKRNSHAKKFVKMIAGIDPKSRADRGKPRLIISEKKNKKAEKYLTKDLPYPYTSKAQFERSMEVPIGTEWNTRIGFQRQTLPRVVKKMGTIIDPLEKIL